MDWFGGYVVIEYKDGTSRTVYDVSLAQANNLVSEAGPLVSTAMYYPYPLQLT